MTGKKRPVDRTPLCGPSYVRRIDPVWMPGPVLPRFWEDHVHRRDYLLWAARRLGLRSMEDLYRLRLTPCFKKNYGGGLTRYWGHSALAAVEDCFPQHNWKPRLFGKAASGCKERLSERIKGLKQCDSAAIGPPPRLSEARVLAWAEAYFAARGKWPTRISGPIAGTRETWSKINGALVKGCRGFPSGSSLAQLLARRCGKRNHLCLPRLSERKILAWADAYFETHGKWPGVNSGVIAGTEERWDNIDNDLLQGHRGLPGGSSLAQLLMRRRGARNRMRLPPFSQRQVLAWADAWFAARGRWPTAKSGPIPAAPETWLAVAKALSNGSRGFPGGSSLPQFLARHRGVRKRMRLPVLNEKQILAWAKAHRKATGRWPTKHSGPIAQSPGTKWKAVDRALASGDRGLPGGSSLYRLLQKHGLK
jgi:hypothetical protein